MQPNQNPYDFINNPNTNAKKSSIASGSLKTRIVQVGLFALIVIVVVMVVFSFLGRGKINQANNFYVIAAQQQGLLDITKIGAEKVRDSKSNYTMSTTNTVISSQSYNFSPILAAGTGNKKPEKQVAALKDTSYTEALTAAEAAGKYDEVFLALYTKKLNAYANQLRVAAATSKGKTKATLIDFYNQLEPLSLEQAAAAKPQK